jgi:hypothetical protein
MGNIKSRLSLTSTGSSTTTTAGFGISVTDSLTIEAPVVNLASGTVTSSTGPNTILGTGVTDTTYVYIKYVSKDGGTPVLVLSTAENTQDFADLAEGEAIFLPVKGAKGIRVTSSTTDEISYEYGYWTKA